MERGSTIGKDVRSAVKTAVMTEDNAKTFWLVMQIGVPDEIPQEDMEKLHCRYSNVYG
jgi:L-ribulose-5-phosphate 4-epimerase